MTRGEEATTVGGYRRVTREQLVAILREIEGMPTGAVHVIAQIVWRSVPDHRHPRTLWARTSRALESLRAWLRLAEGSPDEDPRVVAISQLAAMASEAEGLGYATLVMLGVDALRAEGLALRSSRRSRRRGALEIMADVLYWVWRKPDPRAGELRRTAESLGPAYWKAKKAKRVDRAKPGSMSIERDATERPFIWIPGRPPLARGRNS